MNSALPESLTAAAARIDSVQFSVLSSRDVKSLAVCVITEPTGAKDKTNTPYDPRLGVTDRAMKCVTCYLPTQTCPGHFGMITLPVPVPNHVFIKYLLPILSSVCHMCSSLRVRREQLATLPPVGPYEDKVKHLRAVEALCSKYSTCPNEKCGAPLQKITLGGRNSLKITNGSANLVPLLASDARKILKAISDEDVRALGFECSSSTEARERGLVFRPEDLIIKHLIVIPPAARPSVERDGRTDDDDLTVAYDAVIRYCKSVRTKLRKKDEIRVRLKAEDDLRAAIWSELMNSSDDSSAKSVSSIGTTGGLIGNASSSSSSSRTPRGIMQRIASKEGRVQANVVGKRVDFSARSVIIGDGLDLRDDQLGVPHIVAETLTKEERATSRNVEYLQALVDAGQVSRVVRGDGMNFRLGLGIGPRRFRIEIGDIVHRHLRDNDVVIFNRQPSLRVESFLAFRVKRIDGFAFRLGLAWTSGFNADFDGEHFPPSSARRGRKKTTRGRRAGRSVGGRG
jgi:DNA-directed RNA polymerase beta' subunit